MHSYKIFPLTFCLLVLLVFSCDKPQKNNDKIQNAEPEETIKSKSNTKNLNYKLEVIDKKDKPCINNECARVKVQYPIFDSEIPNNKTINKIIDQKISKSLSDFVMDTKSANGIHEIIDAFIAGYRDFKSNFPEVSTPWFMEIDARPTYQSMDFISMRFDLNRYTGGAHNNSERIYININSRGKEIEKWSYFFRDKVRILELAEATFRKDQGLTSDQSLSAAGFLFSDDKFTLSDNFGFEDKGLIIYYNSYEIVDNSKGPSEIFIPFSALKDNFRF
ncbi:MAG: hypothetical protein ACJA08_002192 [Cyclobacteriaceae bacterium]|jgi:hypothetical protein